MTQVETSPSLVKWSNRLIVGLGIWVLGVIAFFQAFGEFIHGTDVCGSGIGGQILCLLTLPVSQYVAVALIPIMIVKEWLLGSPAQRIRINTAILILLTLIVVSFLMLLRIYAFGDPV